MPRVRCQVSAWITMDVPTDDYDKACEIVEQAVAKELRDLDVGKIESDYPEFLEAVAVDEMADARYEEYRDRNVA